MTNEERAELNTEVIIDVLNNLISTFEEENKLLEKHKVKELKTITGRKNKLAIAYQGYLKNISTSPTWLKEADKDDIAEIKDLCRELEILTKRNKRSLEAHMAGNKRMAEIIITSVKNHQASENTIYREKGQLTDSCGNLPERKYLTLNQSI